MNLLTRLLRREPEISRYSLDQYANDVWLSFQGNRYLLNGGSTGWTKTEDLEQSFTSYINSLYKSNGIVFAIVLARMLLFTEGRFCWFEIGDNGEDGRPAGREGLEVLEKPWPNCGTGELLARMEQDVSLGGNFYAVREGDRLRRLRPDWVTIVLTAPPAESTYADVAGYWYHPGRSYSNVDEPNRGDEVYLPGEVAHFSPIPDPDAQYRGMSWLTPVVREVMADKSAMEHKLNFFMNGATFGAIISAKESLTNQQYKEWKANFEGIQSGVGNAYKTLFLASPVDTSVTTANMQQLDFKVTVGAGETRLCAAGGVPPIIVGLSEGLSSATYSNYGMARRKFGDHWAHPQWKMASTALGTVVDPPKDDLRLGVNTKGIPFLREDAKEAAEILQIKASLISTLITAGYEPDSAGVYSETGDPADLKHTGLTSVQLLPPGTQDADGDGRPDAEVEDEFEYEALLEEMRAQFADEDEIQRDRYDVRNPAGSVGGGRFRRLSDAIIALLRDHDGDGDPLEDFNQAQLRTAARQLGLVEPRQRTTRGQLKLALLKHARGGSGAAPLTGRAALDAPRARLVETATNPDAAPLERDYTYALAWRDGQPSGLSQADVDEASRVLYKYTAELGDATPWAIRDADMTAETRDAIAAIDRVMSASPLDSDIRVWRGLRRPEVVFGSTDTDLTGRTVTDRGFMSTTSDREVAGRYADEGQFVLELTVPAGTGAIQVQDEDLDSEVLLDRNLSLEVVEDSGPGSAPRLVRARVVPGRPEPDSVQVARERQADIDAARRYSGVAGELDELINNEASDAALFSRLSNAGERYGITEEIAAVLGTLRTGGPGDRDRARALMRRVLEREGITQDGAAGESGRFDPKVHAPIDGTIRQGAAVEVVRPGFTLERPSDPVALRQIEVENRVRAAYRAIRARRTGTVADADILWVGLADLRAELDDIPRGEQDQILRRMLGRDRGNVRLIPEENQKTITGADEAAAIDLNGGGDFKHLIGIEDPSDRPLPRDGERIRLSKAVVEEAGEGPDDDDLGPAPAPTYIQPTAENPVGAHTVPPDDMRASPRNGETVEMRFGIRKLRGVVVGQTQASTGERFLVIQHEDGTYNQFDERALHSIAPAPGNEAGGAPDAPLSPRQEYLLNVADANASGKAPLRVGDEDAARDLHERGLVEYDAKARTVEITGRGQRRAKSLAPSEPATPDPLSSLRTLDPEAARDALDLKKVPELKAMLREAGLPVSGRKRELVDRLVGHVHPQGSAPEAGHAAIDAQRRSGWKPGDKLIHKTRGEVTYIGPDERDPVGIAGRGSAQVVEFDDGNEGMVSATMLSGYVPPPDRPDLQPEPSGHLHPGDSPTEARPRRATLNAAEVAGQISNATSEADVITLLASDPALTAAKLRKIAEYLGIDIPEGMKAKSSLQLLIAEHEAEERNLPGGFSRSQTFDADDITRAEDEPEDDDPGEPDDEQRARARTRMDEVDEDAEEPDDSDYEDETSRAAGADTNLGGERLHYWWTKGPGLSRWASSPHPWSALYTQLREHVGAARAKRMASAWFKEVFGIWSGERKGDNPVGPG